VKPRMTPIVTPLAVAAFLALGSLAGCGDDDSNAEQQAGSTQPSEKYAEVLSDLKEAAVAGSTYGALKRGDPLPAPEESAIDAFCETAWQLEINAEQAQLARTGYIAGRIRSFAELNMGLAHIPGRASEPKLTAALAELDEVVDLASLDAELNRNYKRACYR
jgi:hypothetical protein